MRSPLSGVAPLAVAALTIGLTGCGGGILGKVADSAKHVSGCSQDTLTEEVSAADRWQGATKQFRVLCGPHGSDTVIAIVAEYSSIAMARGALPAIAKAGGQMPAPCQVNDYVVASSIVPTPLGKDGTSSADWGRAAALGEQLCERVGGNVWAG